MSSHTIYFVQAQIIEILVANFVVQITANFRLYKFYHAKSVRQLH